MPRPILPPPRRVILGAAAVGALDPLFDPLRGDPRFERVNRDERAPEDGVS